MPKSSLKRQEFAQKKPYLVAAVIGVGLAMGLVALAEGKIAEVLGGKKDDVHNQLVQMTQKSQKLKTTMDARTRLFQEAQGITELSESHFYWMKILAELRQVMTQAELNVQSALTAANDGTRVDVGVWVDDFEPELPAGSQLGADDWASGSRLVYNSGPGRTPPPGTRRPSAAGQRRAEARARRLWRRRGCGAGDQRY